MGEGVNACHGEGNCTPIRPKRRPWKQLLQFLRLGHFADGQFADRPFADRTVRRQETSITDSSPTEQFADRTVGHWNDSSYQSQSEVEENIANQETTLNRKEVYCECENNFFTAFSVDVEEKETTRSIFHVAFLNFFTNSHRLDRMIEPMYCNLPG